MPVSILPTSDPNVNALPEEVFSWAERSGERGLLNPTTARLKIAATKRILSILADDERLGASEILQQLDQLVARLARREGGTPETLSTYKQRAESLLRDFIEYQRDPLQFQSKNAERPAKVAVKVEKKKPAGEMKPETNAESAAQSAMAKRYTYPLGVGRDFEYVLPDDGLTMRDVKKIALHFISLAKDYDPPGESVGDLTRRVRPLEMLEDQLDHVGE